MFDLRNNMLGDTGEGPLPPAWLSPASQPKLRKLLIAGNKGGPADHPSDDKWNGVRIDFGSPDASPERASSVALGLFTA